MSSAQDAQKAPAPPADRGSLRIDHQVVRKVASQAASEVTAAGGLSGGLLGLGQSRDVDARPDAQVHISGRTVVVQVRCGVAYPAPLAKTTDNVRASVIRDVQRLTGLTVTRVDIDVRWLARITKNVRPA